MSDEKTQLQISYIEKEVKEISKRLGDMVSAQASCFNNCQATFVRSDLMAERFGNLTSTLNDIKIGQNSINQKVEAHDEFMPMFRDIRKERESIKNQFINMAGKVLFWVAASALAIAAVVKK